MNYKIITSVKPEDTPPWDKQFYSQIAVNAPIEDTSEKWQQMHDQLLEEFKKNLPELVALLFQDYLSRKRGRGG